MVSKFKDKVGSDNAREKSRGSSYGHLMLPRGVKMFTVKGGDRVRLDFLPYTVSEPNHPCRNDKDEVATPGEQWYRRPYKVHRNIGATKESVLCPTSINKKCPICEYRTKIQKEGKASDDEIKALKYSERNLYVVVPLGHKEFEEDIHLFDISKFCFQDMLRDETDEKPEYRVFFDPSDEGYTVSCRFSEEQAGKNKFAAVSRIDFEERKKGEGYDEEFLEGVPDVDKCLVFLSYKEIEAKFFELDDTDVAKEEDEIVEDPKPTRRRVEPEPEQEAPRRRRQTEEPPAETTTTRRRRADPEPEEEKEAELPFDQDEKEPEEEQPKLQRRQRTAKNVPECPHGHRFGVDTDKFPKHCNNCEIWEQCIDALEASK